MFAYMITGQGENNRYVLDEVIYLSYRKALEDIKKWNYILDYRDTDGVEIYRSLDGVAALLLHTFDIID